MKNRKGYRKIPLGFTRRMVIASVNGNKKNAIHCLTKVDVSKPQKLRQRHLTENGQKLSFTAYIIRCFAEAIKEFPEMNSFVRGNYQILLDDINISVMVEREIDRAKIPEPLGLQQVQNKTVRQLHDEIRSAQNNQGNKLGNLSGTSWISWIPAWLMRTFIKLADQNVSMAKRYGKLAVTAVGMFSNSATWFIPHGTATVLLTIGSIQEENKLNEDGCLESQQMLHLTASFDHEIIDGAPAARFMKCLEKIIRNGEFLENG